MSLDTSNTEDVSKEDEPFGLGCALEVFTEIDEVLEMIANIKTVIDQSQSVGERAYERFVYILGQYLEQPHLLDSHIDLLLDKFIYYVRDPESSMNLKHLVFKYMFVIINVRGYKVVVRHLPHEVSDFEPVLKLLESQDPSDSDTWMTRYVLLLWLSIIVMIPFHMSRLDGFDTAVDTSSKSVMCRVLDVCKCYAIVPDKCRDAAAYLASRFLIRYDVKEQYLSSFIDWACKLSVAPDSTVFIKYGCLASVGTILKHGKREDLLPYVRKLLQWIVNAEFKNNPGTNVQKLVYKNIQRIGLTFLPTRVTTWRYQRGNRSLVANLSAGDGKISECTASLKMDDENLEIEIPDEVEEVIDLLIQGLASGDGVVRWSAAKGIGRVTGRLPKELADDVVGSVLELFNPREGDGAWHGGCLALAELGRRGLLLPQRLPEVVPLVLKALVYDEPRGYSSVGSHIRDAACYVCWSFARAYETHILQPFVKDIASTLLIVTCFDREINCRRAASAAFQENVGRQGTFPHGIDILTTADFFAVSVRNNAYLSISVYIAQFEEYTTCLIKHLVERKVDHWDIAIRELAAKSLHNLTAKAPRYMATIILPIMFTKSRSIDLNSRHGAVLAIGEIIHALSKIQNSLNKLLDKELLDMAEKLIPTFYEQLYFRGLGGELMRQACSSFIEKCSLSRMPLSQEKLTEDWLILLNECLSYDVVSVRMAAINALPAFLNEYYKGTTEEQLNKQKVLVQMYIDQLAVTNQVTRMGHALALGTMPDFILKQHLDEIISALITATIITPSTSKWAESRRDTIKALTSICVTLEGCTELNEGHINQILNSFLDALTEYTQDNRGDIGAWVRESAMMGLQTLVLLLVNRKPGTLMPELVTKILSGVAQQAVEKIDRTRALAGKIFYSFIHNDPRVPNIPNYDELSKIFAKDECELLNWNSAGVTFPKFVQLIGMESYTYNLVLGVVSSVGGLTESLVKSSSASLFSYLKSEEQKKGVVEINRLCDVIHKIFCDFRNVNRITVPMFRFLDKLLSSGCIKLVIHDANSEFPRKILKLIQLEITGCKDIYKLIDGIDVLCQFVQINSEVCSIALVQLSILLCHRQTYVRRSTSNKLYEALLVYGDNSVIPVENLDEIMTLLSNTNWEDSVDVLKPIRNNLCNLMGIRVPVPKKKT